MIILIINKNLSEKTDLNSTNVINKNTLVRGIFDLVKLIKGFTRLQKTQKSIDSINI